MHFGHLQYRPARLCSQQSGYALIVVIFMMTILVISALAVTASITEQIKRDHEDEMVHRGVQYMRAIKRYYKKFGQYPATLEALEETNHIRFLRKRYKDPMTKDGKWVLVRYGQVQFGQQGGPGFNNSGQPGLPNVPGVTSMFQGQGSTSSQNSTSSFGSSSTTFQSSFGQSFGQSNMGQSSFGQSNSGQSSFGSGFGQSNSQQQQQSGQTGLSPSTNGTTGDSSSGFGSTTTGSTGNNLGQSATGLIGTGAIGGGAIIGVASMSKDESLRIVADKNHYNEWRFVYDPTFDRGALITGPYDPKKAMGQFAGATQPGQSIGTPAGQPSNGFGNNTFGNSFGQQGGGQQAQPPTQPMQPPNQQ